MQKFIIDFEEVTEEKFYEELETQCDYECEDNFDDLLDETNDEVDICGYTYPASEALKCVDPTAYRCSLVDWESEKLEEYKDELDRYGSVSVNGTDFEIEEVDDDEEEEEEN